jgi:hypothetical protein
MGPYRENLEQPFKVIERRLPDHQRVEPRYLLAYGFNGNDAHPQDRKKAEGYDKNHKNMLEYSFYINIFSHYGTP